MSAVGSKLRRLADNIVAFWCPGCKTGHQVWTDRWQWNGSGNVPTFSPSVLVTGTEPITDKEHAVIMGGEKVTPRTLRCHSFVADGKVRFLNDCTHDLAGQTVDLPDWPGASS